MRGKNYHAATAHEKVVSTPTFCLDVSDLLRLVYFLDTLTFNKLSWGEAMKPPIKIKTSRYAGWRR